MAIDYQTPQQTAPARGGSGLKLILAWLLVGVPAAWGVGRTVQNSLPLFRSTATTASTPTTAPAAAR